ncbi:MAG: DUF554 domain-containing protein [Alistipes sp.]|nr:DUF554 domain-containing protein [Alistipes sp.]
MGINILGIKKIAVLDMLPALAVIILLSYFRDSFLFSV